MLESCSLLSVSDRKDQVRLKLYFQPEICMARELMTKHKASVKDCCEFPLAFVKQMTGSSSNEPVSKTWNAFGEIIYS